MSDTLILDVVAVLRADATLSPLMARRIYPDIAPQGAALPFVVYTDISLSSSQTLDGTNGNRSARIQFDFYAATQSQAHALKEAGLALFDGYQGALNARTVVQHSALSNYRKGFDNDQGIHNYSIDIEFDYKI